MPSITVRKRLQVPKDLSLLCESGGLGLDKAGDFFIGKVWCDKPSMFVHAMEHRYEGMYPLAQKSCGGGDPNIGHRCTEVAPGFTHPHVIFLDNYTYTLHIDLPYY